MCGGHVREVFGMLLTEHIRAAVACRDLGVRCGIGASGGLRRLLRYHADRLNGRLAHAAVLAFGLGAGWTAAVKAWKWVQTVPTSHQVVLQDVGMLV